MELTNVKTIPELSNFLVDLKRKQDSDSALSFALNAQLQVITVVQRINLASSPFDLMLESLKNAVQKSTTEQMKEEYQRRAAIMVNSMIFFMEAKMYYEEDKWEKEGQNILKEGCKMLAETTTDLALTSVTGGVIPSGFTNSLANKLLSDIVSNRGGLISRVIDWVAKSDRIENNKIEFYQFLETSFDKLSKYHSLFGNSLLLHNLILRYKNNLKIYGFDKSAELYAIDPKNKILRQMRIRNRMSSFLRIVSIIAIIFCLFNAWGGDKWVESLANTALFDVAYHFHFWFLDLSWFFQLIIILLAALPLIILTNSKKDDQLYLIADEYYSVLASKFDNF
ncbi:hypothetical protein M2138_002126 [Dysgonomonadaceae bacterium PH5-43]|nr:hypothetical protein [Dysgonomonadaceae bacterium PH5-43]